MLDIHLISITNVDWTTFVKKVESHTGTSPTRSLDARNIAVGSLESYVHALTSFCYTNSYEGKYEEILLKHCSVGFLISGEKKLIYDIMLHGSQYNLRIDTNDYLTIVITGTLYHWRIFIITYMKENMSLEIRQTLNSVIDILEKVSFTNLFSDYRKIQLSDGSFILERRNA